jgi:hypothetical protein
MSQNKEQKAEITSVSQHDAKLPVIGSRHRWVKQEEDGSFVCQHCGVRKKNIWMGWGKNGKAALYFLKDGERTSYRPDCR